MRSMRSSSFPCLLITIAIGNSGVGRCTPAASASAQHHRQASFDQVFEVTSSGHVQSTGHESPGRSWHQALHVRGEGHGTARLERHELQRGKVARRQHPQGTLALSRHEFVYERMSNESSTTQNETLQCNSAVHISETNGAAKCPADCPYMAEFMDTGNKGGCWFECIAKENCGKLPGLDQTEIVADDTRETPTCRSCNIAGCETCNQQGEDKCDKCRAGWVLSSDAKQCVQDGYQYLWITVAVLFASLALFLVVYLVRLRFREVVNLDGLKQGLTFRSRQKLRVPLPPPMLSTEGLTEEEIQKMQREKEEADKVVREAEEEMREEEQDTIDEFEEAGAMGAALVQEDKKYSTRVLFPKHTNLKDPRVAQIAGPGLLLHFNFTWMTILWGMAVSIIWGCFVLAVDFDLLTLGWRVVKSKHQFCTVVVRGHRIQQEYMFEKALCVFVIYIVTTIMFVLHAARQRRKFHRLDSKTETMRDFAVLLVGLPRMKGDAGAEDKIQKALAEAAGEQVVGISIMWDLGEEGGVARCLAEKVVNVKSFGEDKFGSLPGSANYIPEPAVPDPPGGIFRKVDESFKDFLGVDPEESEEWQDPVARIQSLECCGAAWAVFPTESARTQAVEKLQEAGGFQLKDDETGEMCTVVVEAAGCEPETVRWGAFKLHSRWVLAWRLGKGCIGLMFALVAWAAIVYVPYAYSAAKLAHLTGNSDNVGFVQYWYFTLSVVLGNQLIYVYCDGISEGVGFRYEDTKQAAYVVMYTVACFINVLFDVIVNYMTVYNHLLYIGASTFDGTPLDRLVSFQEVFESFSMQQALGKNMFDYTFPSCLLYPFLLEPLAFVVIFRIQCWFVRSDPSLVRDRAERAMSLCIGMDLGRYADCLLNLLLCVLILFFPGGFTLPLFVMLSACHLYIYHYDKLRVLRYVPGFAFSSDTVDICASLMLSLVAALLLVIAIFKGNCQKEAPYCLRGAPLLGVLFVAACLHIMLHTFLVLVVVPKFVQVPHDLAHHEYQQVAEVTPCTWFSANPMHCLRSFYIHKHDPPHLLYIRGNEHLQVKNPKIGSYFEDAEAKPENFKYLVRFV